MIHIPIEWANRKLYAAIGYPMGQVPLVTLDMKLT